MSLEYALEKFPLSVFLKDGTECVIRPLGKRDQAKLRTFFAAVPEHERLFIKQSVVDGVLMAEWCRKLDYQLNLPLLMLHENRIIGEVTLHQRHGGWKRHIGMVTVLTHPEYRGRDVARILVQEIVRAARHLGLNSLEAELNGERNVAIRALEMAGFRQLFRLPDYVVDMQSSPHDYVMMGMTLRADEEYAGLGD